jgi:hypothetical protein
MGVELLRYRIDPAIVRRDAQGRPAPDLHHGSHRRRGADSAALAAARQVWRATPQVPDAGGHAWSAVCASRWLGLAPDAA